MKIVQISAASNGVVYGLGDDGNLYVWSLAGHSWSAA